MPRVVDLKKIYEVYFRNTIETMDEKLPHIGQRIKVDEWDETGITISHNIHIKDILKIEPFRHNEKDEWSFKYIILSD